MRKSIFSLLVLFFFMGCNDQFEPLDDYPNSHLLVSSDDLYELIQGNDILLIDAREEIEDGVIPGAVHFAAISSLTDPDHEVDHFLIGPETFQQKMQELGLNSDDRVIIYDDGNALAAARLFYALDYYGFSNASILNGGFQGWKEHEYSTEDEPSTRGSGTFTFDVQEGRSCDFEYVLAAAESDDKIIFDARSRDEYTGEDKRASLGGHIPNAVNLEWSRVLKDDGVPYFREASEIQGQYAALGITPDKEVIPHCHTNVRGSHAYFTLRLMGYDSVRPYEGSWEEYGNREDAAVQ